MRHRFLPSPTLHFFGSLFPRPFGPLFLCLSVSLILLSSAHAQQPPPPERIYTAEEISRDIGGPTLLTLHLHNVAPRAVFEAVTAQSGIRFLLNDQGAPTVSVDCDRQPFWQAMASILNQTGYTLYGNNADSLYRLVTGAKPITRFLSGPTAMVGPFVVELQRGSIAETFPVSFEKFDPPPQDAAGAASFPLNLDGRVLCDPKLQLFSVQTSVEAVTDDTGTPLANPRSAEILGGYNGMPREAPISMTIGGFAPGTTHLKTLGGRLRLQVSTQAEKWEIPDAVNAGIVTKEFGGAAAPIKVTLKANKNEAGVANVLDVAITVVGGKSVAAQLADSIMASARWFDAAGRPIDYMFANRGSGGQIDKATMKASYFPADREYRGPAPVVLALTIPTDIRTVDFPFAISNVPLP